MDVQEKVGESTKYKEGDDTKVDQVMWYIQ